MPTSTTYKTAVGSPRREINRLCSSCPTAMRSATFESHWSDGCHAIDVGQWQRRVFLPLWPRRSPLAPVPSRAFHKAIAAVVGPPHSSPLTKLFPTGQCTSREIPMWPPTLFIGFLSLSFEFVNDFFFLVFSGFFLFVFLFNSYSLKGAPFSVA